MKTPLIEHRNTEGQVPYDRLASVYNRHFGVYAERLVPILWQLLLRGLPPGACIVDLCCGTGQLAGVLSRRGFRIVGIDESREMLRFAKRNAPGARFIQADAAAFRLDQPACGVVSTFDSVNHFVEPDVLAAVFRNVFRNLATEGVFVFDMNMEDGFLARWRGEWEGIEDGRRYRIQAVYDEKSGLGRNVVTMYHGGRHKRWSIHERCYPKERILGLLADAGFKTVNTYDAERELDLLGAVGRTFFVCRKPSAAHAVPNRRVAERAPRNSGRLRSLSRCSRDGVYPSETLERELKADSVRLKAVREVMCTLPESVHQQLISLSSSINWFVPDETVLGQVRSFPAGACSKVIYLSPHLEHHRLPVVIVAVAHEIAHVVLGHRLKDLDAATYERQEHEARRALQEWGYGEVMGKAESALLM